jgi:hypothetical protein
LTDLSPLEEARAATDRLHADLIEHLDFRTVSKKRAKVPVNALLFVHAMEWRTEELARNACDAYARTDVVTGIVLTRGVMECAAAVWELMDFLSKRAPKLSDDEVQDYVLRLLMGHKIYEDMPTAINVMSMLDRVTKIIPGFRDNYERLSEFAHPNWSGAMGVYIKTDKEALTATFGRNPRERETPLRMGTVSLNGALAALEYARSKLRKLIPELVVRIEKSLPD